MFNLLFENVIYNFYKLSFYNESLKGTTSKLSHLLLLKNIKNNSIDLRGSPLSALAT
jgi:hypothetical protein